MDIQDYLDTTIKQFYYYKTLGEQTFEQLTDEQLFWQFNDESNNIAIIVKHLHGNMLSRWTDFLTSDGEKEWRERDAEFEDDLPNRTGLLDLWETGWKCLFNAIESLNHVDLNKTIYIRNMGQSVPAAINRQLAHYAYHVGQIVFIGKMILNDQWQSLSIPKGASSGYNAVKFSKQKHDEHFTDEFINKKE